MDKLSKTIILKKGEGRKYDMGAMQATFLADEQETEERYAVSEWWLKPGSEGPGAHQHEFNDEVFYVLEGVMSFLVGDKWIDAAPGTFLRIPARTMHDFSNKTNDRAGLLNFFIPGGFERNMPSIIQWFNEKKQESL